jgi:glycerate dehydrogenase
MPKIVVLDGYVLNPGDLSWESLRELGDLEVFDRTPESAIVERIRQAELILTSKVPLTAENLDALTDLRYIGVLATGYNIIDTKAAAQRGIVVTNIPSYGTASVAQFTIGLLLELCHRIGWHDSAVKAGEWSRNLDWSLSKAPMVELSGNTIGLIGFGRIGRHTGRIADALEMRVIAADVNRKDPPPWPGFGWREVPELLSEADVVSLHCPLTAETHGLIDRHRLALMNRSAFLINASRGPLVVEQDLADALNTGRIAGAAVDVLSVEPPVNGSPLFSAKNCIVTPHIAWATREARARLVGTGIANVAAFLKGTPQNVVG